MPVTARFSSGFYERLGDEVAQELVNWFNDVNQDYRDQLSVTNERNWRAFEAKLDGSTAEIRSRLDSSIADVQAELRGSIADVRAELRGSMAELRAELIKWMFGFWIAFWLATVIPLGGLILTR